MEVSHASCDFRYLKESMLMKAEALVRMRYGLQPIVARITLKERHDVSVLHPRGN